MPVVCKLLSIKAVEAAEVCSNPENILMIYPQAYNYIIAKAVFIVWIVQELFERILLPVEKNQSSTIGANPPGTKTASYLLTSTFDNLTAFCIAFHPSPVKKARF